MPALTAPSRRLVGLDVARGLAVLGMIVAHVGSAPDTVHLSDPSSWTGLVHGRSSTLFAVLAGVSIAMTTGREHPPQGAALRAARRRIAVRGALIAGIGVLLMTLQAGPVVILAVYGILFVAVLPAITWRPRTSFVVAGVLALLALPTAVVVAAVLISTGSETAWLTAPLGTYPPVTFLAYLLLGLGVGRLDLRARVVQARLAVTGAALALLAYGVGGLFVPEDTADAPVLGLLLQQVPHSSSIADVVGTAGVALLVVGAALSVADGTRAVHGGPLWTTRRIVCSGMVVPLAAVGSIPLTVYVAHVVVIWTINLALGTAPLGWAASGWAWGFVIVTVAAALLVRRTGRRGPLEATVSATVDRVAGRGRRSGTEGARPRE